MAEPLVLNSVIGFGGAIENGLIAHPDGRTIIYPLGSTIVLRDRADPRSQEFLQGHSDKVGYRTEPCGSRRAELDNTRPPPFRFHA